MDLSCHNSKNWFQGNGKKNPRTKDRLYLKQWKWLWSDHHMSVRTECAIVHVAVSSSIYLWNSPLLIKTLAHWSAGASFPLDTNPLSPLVASLRNKATIPFYEYCLSTGFQVVNSCTRVSVTQNVLKSFAANITVVHWLQFQIYLFMLPAYLSRSLRMSWDTGFCFSQAFLGDSGVEPGSSLGKEGTSGPALERTLLVGSGASPELLSAGTLLLVNGT